MAEHNSVKNSMMSCSRAVALWAWACSSSVACYGAIPPATAMAVDPAGNIWLTGHTTGPDSVPVTRDAIQPAFISSTCGSLKIPPGIFIPVNCGDAFVIKLDPSGTRVLYATYLGGHGDDGGLAIAVDRSGSVYVAGYTGSPDFPISSGAFQSKNAGPPVATVLTSGELSPGGDVFITKLNPDGSLAYSTFLGGSGNDTPSGIRVDDTGFAYVAGTTASADFPLTPSPLGIARGGGFIAKISPAGDALSFSTYFQVPISGLAIDSVGAAYVTGSTDGLLAATPGAAQVKIGGATDGFAAKVDPSGKRLVYSTYLGGSSYDYGVAIGVDSHGAAWVGGATRSENFPNKGGVGGAFLLKVAPDGAAIETGTSFGMEGVSANGSAFTDFVAVDQEDNVYASGFGLAAHFHLTPNAALAQPCSLGSRFLLEQSPAGSPLYGSFLRRSVIPAVTSPSSVLMFVTRDSSAVALDLTAFPALNFECPVNGASFSRAGITAGEVVSLFGRGLGPQTGVIAKPDPSGHIPASLAGVEVRFDDIPAPVLYAQAGQVNVVAPLASQFSFATIEVTYNGQSVGPLDVNMEYASPGIFAVLNQDGQVNSLSNPAKLGSTLQVFATGLILDFADSVSDGEIAPIPPPLIPLKQVPEVLFAGNPGTVVWAGAAPGLIIGVIQLNVQIPESIFSGTTLGPVPMTVQYGVYSSPPTLVSIVK